MKTCFLCQEFYYLLVIPTIPFPIKCMSYACDMWVTHLSSRGASFNKTVTMHCSVCVNVTLICFHSQLYSFFFYVLLLNVFFVFCFLTLAGFVLRFKIVCLSDISRFRLNLFHFFVRNIVLETFVKAFRLGDIHEYRKC